jgi:hypothetical protein
MITLLAVGDGAGAVAAGAGADPSLEVLIAKDAEDALEKLARNRRIDAVLIVDSRETAALAASIRDEDPAGPPLFAPASAGEVPGVEAVSAESSEGLAARIARALSHEG